MARARDNDIVLMVVMLFGGMTLLSWFSSQPTWLRVAVLVAAVFASYGWWVLFGMPTTCGVINRSNARGCSNNVKGLLRACRLADHKARKQKLLWARILRRSPKAPSEPARRTSQARVQAPPTTVHISMEGFGLEGAGYKAIMLICTIVTTLFTVATGLMTVTGLTTS